jgi:L-aminoadipate-semialdehyde dehydrogenase
MFLRSDIFIQVEKSARDDEVPFQELLAHLSSDSEDFRPSFFKVRFFNLTDTSPEILLSSTTSGNCDLTIFISQETTLRRILPIQIKIAYNSVLFTGSRIEFLVDQLELLLKQSAANPNEKIAHLSLLTDKSKAILPDPLAELEWDEFKGSITDIFAKNSASHPHRTCVVESIPSSELSREFTYRQINNSANLLANYLLKCGTQREDVVVLYSYRGVDLVVAIMGVLKAGATFSVIDPAYPPSRQIIYLSVAKPSAIIVLEKAGKLDVTVEEYIAQNINLTCRLDGLILKDDSSLHSINVDFETMSTTDNPNVVLGPDSVATLSFTSGSTGIPKGVRGRHFSLTHFYPWMKQEFNLTEAERFTMLSGIAHDPIQRDIFTPLFLGAQLHIPTVEDIGMPGALAKWMYKQSITITHLTPAMGQLLSANATQKIPSLRNSFFVGDVLTKRDVLRLQHLASNTHVINMYGTTETQRAVSYLDIPPLETNPGYLSEKKDVMPAGKGMKNVQLLVVTPSGNRAGVGELGEIYVRSGGLAEGYLALPEVTKEKFLKNPFRNNHNELKSAKGLPFFHGPRDRMYKTGDVGRYCPDGSVECTGRADDQVKIRGFRIELGEIDTHLSQNPSVRENVTLVRRDKNEEMTLVTYFVPMSNVIENMGELIIEIREYLKQKLPSYAIPTGILA